MNRLIWVIIIFGLFVIKIENLGVKFSTNFMLKNVVHWSLSNEKCTNNISSSHFLYRYENWLVEKASIHPEIRDTREYLKNICEKQNAKLDPCDLISTDLLSPIIYLDQTIQLNEFSLQAFQIDLSSVELNNSKVPLILYWISDGTDRFEEIISVDKYGWCGISEDGYLIQKVVAQSMVRNGGFEWFNFRKDGPPTFYMLPKYDPSNNIVSYYSVIKGTDSNNTWVRNNYLSLLSQENNYSVLYQVLPIVGEDGFYLQGGSIRTSDGALADLGGSWETEYGRVSAFAARKLDTKGEWLLVNQVILPESGAKQFTFRIANSGNKGQAEFDNIFFLKIPLPDFTSKK